MKRALAIGLALNLLVLLFAMIGCGKEQKDKPQSKETEIAQREQLSLEEHSIPTAKSLAKRTNQYEPLQIAYSYDKYLSKTEWTIMTAGGKIISKAQRIDKRKAIFVYKVSVQTRFEYDGGKLLTYETGLRYITTDRTITKYNQFDNWRCDFQYGNLSLEYVGIADGARAQNLQGKVLAKAKLRGLIKDEQTSSVVGIEVEEIHLNPQGQVIFQAISQFEIPSGFKRVEQRLRGEKEHEYFPVWPVIS